MDVASLTSKKTKRHPIHLYILSTEKCGTSFTHILNPVLLNHNIIDKP